MSGPSGEFSSPYAFETPAGLRNEDYVFRVVKEAGVLEIEQASAIDNVKNGIDFYVFTDDGQKVNVQFKTYDLGLKERARFLEKEKMPIFIEAQQIDYAKREEEWRHYVIAEFVDQFDKQYALWQRIHFRQGRVNADEVEKALK